MRRLAGWIGLALLAPVAEADSFRCGTRLIVEGSTRAELKRLCGEPTEIITHTLLRPPLIWYYGQPVRVAGGDIEIQVETWTYNLGPQKLMRRLRLEDGLVVEIETLGYGYHD